MLEPPAKRRPKYPASDKPTCPVEATLELLGGKGKGAILFHLMDGPCRFNQLQRELAGISHRILTKQLRELEECCVVHREVFAEVPPRVEYSLTQTGETLRPLIMAMRDWGDAYAMDLLNCRDEDDAE